MSYALVFIAGLVIGKLIRGRMEVRKSANVELRTRREAWASKERAA